VVQEERTAEAENATVQLQPTAENIAKEKPRKPDSPPTHLALSMEAGTSGRHIHPAMFHVVTEDSSTVRGSAISLLQLTTEPTVTVHRRNISRAPANHARSTATGVDGANGHRAQLPAAMES
jgi:hypothetical protein